MLQPQSRLVNHSAQYRNKALNILIAEYTTVLLIYDNATGPWRARTDGVDGKPLSGTSIID